MRAFNRRLDGLTKVRRVFYTRKFDKIDDSNIEFALEHIPRMILGYMMPELQKYAIDVLAGKIESIGKPPYSVSFN